MPSGSAAPGSGSISCRPSSLPTTPTRSKTCTVSMPQLHRSFRPGSISGTCWSIIIEAEEPSAMEMQDRAVIVTGGASGIGKATALLLAREGARVLVGDIDEAGGRATAQQAGGGGGGAGVLRLGPETGGLSPGFVGAGHRRGGRAHGPGEARGGGGLQ